MFFYLGIVSLYVDRMFFKVIIRLFFRVWVKCFCFLFFRLDRGVLIREVYILGIELRFKGRFYFFFFRYDLERVLYLGVNNF